MAEDPLVGELEQVPLSQIFREIHLAQASGVLDLRRQRDHRRIIIKDGSIRSARSNKMEQRIGQFALKSNAITRVQLMQALSVEDDDSPVGQRLVKVGILTEQALQGLLKRLAQKIIVECFGWESGSYQFKKGRAVIPGGTEIRMPAADVILAGFRAYASDRMARTMIGNLNSILVPSPNLLLLCQHITLNSSEREALDHIDGTSTTSQLVVVLPGTPSDNIATIGSLIAVGLISTEDLEENPSELALSIRGPDALGPLLWTEQWRGDPRAEPPASVASTPEEPTEPGAEDGQRSQIPGAGSFAGKSHVKRVVSSEKEIQRLRLEIKRKYMLLGRGDYYQYLGLPIRATQKEIFYTVQSLCTLYHPDLALQEPFADLKPQLEAVFSYLQEAVETLVDSERRESYDRSEKLT